MKKPIKTKPNKMQTIEHRDFAPVRAEMQFRDNSYDEATNSVEIIWSTGADVLRYNWRLDGYFVERLSMDKSHIRLGRLNSGAASLLKNHWQSVDDVVGNITDAWIENGRGIAKVRLSEAAGDADIVGKIKTGIIRAVSVGYNIHKLTLIEEREDEPNLYEATDWEPFEISIVAVPADADASVRSEQQGGITTRCLIERATPTPKPMENEMKPTEAEIRELETKKLAETRALEVTRAAELEAAKVEAAKEAKTAERARVAEINKACDDFGVDAKQRSVYVGGDITINELREKEQENLAKRSNKFNPGTHVSPDAIGGDAKRNAAIENALLHRTNPTIELEDGAREYRGLSMLEIGRDFLTDQGINARRFDKSELTAHMLGLNSRGGAMTTSDFPSILANVANKQLRMLQANVNEDWKKLASPTTLPDFKQNNIVSLHGDTDFKKKLESGEYEHTTFSDSKTSYSLVSYGRKFSFSRELIINDDLGALLRMSKSFINGKAQNEANLFWAIFTKNQKMGDNKGMFDAAHKNVGAGGVISKDTISELRKLLMLQTAKDSKIPLNLVMKYLIVPVELQTHAEQFLTQITANKTIDVNVFANKFDVIAEPRLDLNSSTKWYGAADPNSIDGIDYAYLEGTGNGLVVESRVNWDSKALEIQAGSDFAVHAIEHRGFVFNAGA